MVSDEPLDDPLPTQHQHTVEYKETYHGGQHAPILALDAAEQFAADIEAQSDGGGCKGSQEHGAQHNRVGYVAVKRRVRDGGVGGGRHHRAATGDGPMFGMGEAADSQHRTEKGACISFG